MITLFIDDQKIMVKEGSTVLEAATAAGIYIPPTSATIQTCLLLVVAVSVW